MHLHEEPQPEPQSEAARHRVKPEELTRALAAIESRRREAAWRQEEAQAAEQAYLSSTIPVEEAIQQLHLPDTPDEIWAEVRAQRETQRQQEAQGKTLPKQESPLEPLPSLRKLPALPRWASTVPRYKSLGRLAFTVLALSLAGVVTLLLLRPHGSPPLNTTTSPPVSSASGLASSGLAYSVASLPDRIPFKMDGEGLASLLRGEDAAKMMVDLNRPVNPNFDWDTWSLIKYEGHVYFRGNVAAPASKDTLPGTAPGSIVDINSVAAAPENGNRPAEITLRVDALKFYSFWEHVDNLAEGSPSFNPFAFRDQKITVSDIHLDQHAWENARYVMSTTQPTLEYSAPATKFAPAPSALPFPSALTPLKHPGERRTPDAHLMLNSAGTLLSLVPDEQPFVLPDAHLKYLLSGTPLTVLRLNPPESYSRPWPEWSAVKHQGHLYVRGWVPGGSNPADMAHGFLHFYNTPTAPELGGTAKQVSLRLDYVQYEPGERVYRRKLPSAAFGTPNNEEQVLLANVRLDEHAWEKW